MSLLFGLLAISNFTKPFQHLRNPQALGMVLLGSRFETFGANAVIGPLMGLVVGAYAWGLWRLRPWVRPLSAVYAFWVPLNLILFWYRQTSPEIPPLGSILGYLTFALGGSIGTALYLAYHPEKLR